MVLPVISNLDGKITVKTSELLVLILSDMLNTKQRTPYVWLPTLKNYVSSMKELSLKVGNQVRNFFMVG